MSKVKIALCQFGLRDTKSFEELESRLKEQCRIAISSKPDIILFPEFLTIGLVAMAGAELTYANLHDAMVTYVAGFTEAYESIFTDLARKSGALIVAGTHWTPDDNEGRAFNTAHLFFPDGHIERQKKNHLFPGEEDWGTATFDGLAVFEIPKARVGVMICYDTEFPEVARHFMLNGAQILLAPSATYTERGFYRVRYCCAARAVENQVYVAECHAVGSLTVPTDKPFTAFGRSAIWCPIDDQIEVNNGIMVEAESSEQEMVVVGEVDLDSLERSRQSSEATILKDRRPHMYKKRYQFIEEGKESS
ncbi:MAG: nitrilase-related carbon-nitrogen hydrolase [Candidatus Hodarchaeota archaeon]